MLSVVRSKIVEEWSSAVLSGLIHIHRGAIISKDSNKTDRIIRAVMHGEAAKKAVLGNAWNSSYAPLWVDGYGKPRTGCQSYWEAALRYSTSNVYLLSGDRAPQFLIGTSTPNLPNLTCRLMGVTNILSGLTKHKEENEGKSLLILGLSTGFPQSNHDEKTERFRLRMQTFDGHSSITEVIIAASIPDVLMLISRQAISTDMLSPYACGQNVLFDMKCANYFLADFDPNNPDDRPQRLQLRRTPLGWSHEVGPGLYGH